MRKLNPRGHKKIEIWMTPDMTGWLTPLMAVCCALQVSNNVSRSGNMTSS